MRRIIFDTDLGIDDALALLYLLASPEADIQAITTVHGNVPVEVATANVFEVLSVAEVATVPQIARGSAAPLKGSGVNATEVHGQDGLGGWTANGRIAAGNLSERPASDLILDIARMHPGEVTLLLIGPATNAALAFDRDPESFRMLNQIVAMGGAICEPGNTTATAEFNVYADPEAAQSVIASGVPLLLVPLDATHKVCLTRGLLKQRMAGQNNRRAQFLRCIAEQGFSFFEKATGWDGMYLHDPLAAAVALDRSLVETRRMKLDIETTGELTRGMTVAERRTWKKGGENAEICVNVDSARFLELFVDRVLR
jgi:purine nucleosidase